VEEDATDDDNAAGAENYAEFFVSDDLVPPPVYGALTSEQRQVAALDDILKTVAPRSAEAAVLESTRAALLAAMETGASGGGEAVDGEEASAYPVVGGDSSAYPGIEGYRTNDTLYHMGLVTGDNDDSDDAEQEQPNYAEFNVTDDSDAPPPPLAPLVLHQP
jgi:hypothetical protein